MAQRRMFSKQITSSSQFLMMSQSAQNLYFHFGMNADDDGFCEVFTVMRMTDSKPGDLQALHTGGFIFVVDNKVCIIKDWHENNQLRMDRYKQSMYLSDPKFAEIYGIVMQEKVHELEMYKSLATKWQPNGTTGKDSIGKDSIGNTPVYLGEERRDSGKDLFDDFWVTFPNRRKGGKKIPRARWDRLPEATKLTILQDLPLRVANHKDWLKSNGDFIPAPEVYLNKEQWNLPIIKEEQKVEVKTDRF